MAKKPSKTPIEKTEFSINDFKKNQGLDFQIKERELAWIPLSEAFHDAVKVPGIPIGYFTSVKQAEHFCHLLSMVHILQSQTY